MIIFEKTIDSNKKYKRIVWAGVRKTEPLPTDSIYPDDNENMQSIEDFIDLEREDISGFRPVYPCLLIWEDYEGREHCVEAVSTYRLPKKTHKR